MKISILQYDTKWQDAKANLQYLDEKIAQLDTTVELVILSEMFTTGVTTDADKVSEKMNGTAIQKMLSWAKEYQIAICGSLLIEEKGKYYNRFIFVTPEQKVNTYDKRHLFRLGGEDKVIEPGKKCDIITYKGWKIKPQICYDLRFPIWSRNTKEDQYDILIYVSNWPKSRNLAYESLLRARALENQVYVCACNRIGVDGSKIVYSGSSMIIDAKGQTLADAESKECSITTDLSKDELNTFRSRFPVLNDGDVFSIEI